MSEVVLMINNKLRMSVEIANPPLHVYTKSLLDNKRKISIKRQSP